MKQDHQDKTVVQKLIKVAILSLIFMSVQIVGGYMANSIAILADAFHLLSDVLAYAISLFAVLFSKRKAPIHLTFGYEKIQPLGALINVALIWVVTVQLCIEATSRIVNKERVHEPLYMLLTSLFGLCCNLVIMKILHSDPEHGHQCNHNHQHGHQHLPIHDHSHGHIHDHSHDQSHSHSHNHGHHDHHKDHIHDHSHSHGNSCNHGHTQQSVINTRKHKHQNNPKNELRSSAMQGNDYKQGIIIEDDRNLQGERIDDQMIIKVQEDGKCHHQSDKLIHLETLHSAKGYDSHLESVHNHQNTLDNISKAKLFENINIEAAYVHIISDIILSIGVILSATLIYTFGDSSQWTPWQLVDPLCTYFFSIMAIYSTISITKESVVILLDGCDNPKLLQSVREEIYSLESLQQLVELKIWTANRGKYYGWVKAVSHHKQTLHKEIKHIFANKDIKSVIEID